MYLSILVILTNLCWLRAGHLTKTDVAFSTVCRAPLVSRRPSIILASSGTSLFSSSSNMMLSSAEASFLVWKVKSNTSWWRVNLPTSFVLCIFQRNSFCAVQLIKFLLAEKTWTRSNPSNFKLRYAKWMSSLPPPLTLFHHTNLTFFGVLVTAVSNLLEDSFSLSVFSRFFGAYLLFAITICGASWFFEYIWYLFRPSRSLTLVNKTPLQRIFISTLMSQLLRDKHHRNMYFWESYKT